MQLRNKFNKGLRFLLCVIDIFSKYAWVVLLKDKIGIALPNGFQKIKKNLIENQTKYGLINEENFIIILLKNG